MSSDAVVRVGVIGTGFGAETLMPAFAATPGIRIEAVCSARLDRAEAAAARFGAATAVDDYRRVVEMKELDLVCVCTPPPLHAGMTMDVLDAGHHVFSTKPLATTLPEATALRDRARDLKVVTAMDLDQRYEPVRRYSRDLVRNGYLGDLRFVILTLMEGYTTDPGAQLYYWNWVSQLSAGGGILGASLLNHHLDLLRYTFGDIESVGGVVSTLVTDKPVLPSGADSHHPVGDPGKLERKPVDTEDAVALQGRFSGGGLFTAAASWSVRHPSGVRVEAYGSDGTLVLEPSGRLLGGTKDDGGLSELAVPEPLRLPDLGSQRISRFSLLARDLVTALTGGGGDPLFATFDDALRLREIAHQVLGR
ncbi:MAG TPA: Gfo/Idh/MocA family oxidoreductase [Acidimicrobiales bacterium]|nr:Gfo/Idh/MocA family oxidoreductase [Acidimicrobiales bacterium]